MKTFSCAPRLGSLYRLPPAAFFSTLFSRAFRSDKLINLHILLCMGYTMFAQIEFGSLSLLFIIIVVAIAIYLLSGFRIIYQYERGVKFSLGSFKKISVSYT